MISKSTCQIIILIQLIILVGGCGSGSKWASLAVKFPGALPSALPGSEIVTEAVFNSYLQSGRLAAVNYDAMTLGTTTGANAGNTTGAGSGGGLKQGVGQEFEAAGRLGDDILAISDYSAKHQNGRFLRDPFTHPSSIVEALDVNGRIRRFHASDNSYRILSVANTIRNQQIQNVRVTQVTPPSIKFQDLKKKPTKRAVASVAEIERLSINKGASTPANTPPKIACDPTELGHGIGSDHGLLSGNSNTSYQAFSDGLISNFDFPLKSVLTCIKDQGIRGSCTAFSVIGAMEALINQKSQLTTNFSEQGLYFRGKGFLDPNSPNTDGFSVHFFLDDFNSTPSFRVSYEKIWDYNISPARKSESDYTNSCSSGYTEFCSNSAGQGHLYCTNPSTGDPVQCGYLTQIASTTVGARVAGSVSFLDPSNPSASLQKAINYLNQGVPVLVETTLTNVFYSPYHGYVSEPTSNDKTVGGHSTLAVGYVSEAQLRSTLPAREVTGNGGFFIIKNSWGTDMGDAGYFYVSFNYLVKYVYSLFAVQSVDFAQ